MNALENEGGSTMAPACSVSGELDRLRESGANRIGLPIGAVPQRCGELASFIDHTLLRADATPREIERLCHEAIQWGFATVCVNPSHVAQCASLLKGSPVKVCTVVGFPLGAMTTEAKDFETRDAIAKGADEIDMVIAVGRLKGRDFTYVHRDIRAVVEAAQGRTVKVILETALLKDEEKVAACAIARAARAHFVKTSTGFAASGATAADVALMRRAVGPALGVKAAGGIRDCDAALAMTRAGADRIGASASVFIVQQG